MSAAYTYPGQAFDHTLQTLKGWYRESSLDAEVAISSNVNINSTNEPVYPGMVVHPVSVNAAIAPYGTGGGTGPGTFVVEMGCGTGMGMPMWLWSGANDPDVSNPGVIPGDPVYGTTARPPQFISVLPRVTNQNLVALVSSGGYEVETTEYDSAQTYAPGEGLRTVTSNTNANAGRVTNQRASSVGFVSTGATQYGDPTASAADTIVGIVSRGEYTNPNLVTSLACWTWYIPGTR